MYKSKVKHSADLGEDELLTIPRYKETPAAGGHAGFVSDYVHGRAIAHMHKTKCYPAMNRIVVWIPDAAPYLF